MTDSRQSDVDASSSLTSSEFHASHREDIKPQREFRLRLLLSPPANRRHKPVMPIVASEGEWCSGPREESTQLELCEMRMLTRNHISNQKEGI